MPAHNALALAERETPRIAEELGIPFAAPYTIHLARGERQLEPRLTALMPRWAVGLTLPFRREVILRLDRLNSPAYPGSFHEVLNHELVHLVMGQIGRKRFGVLPWWFHEGTAQVLSSHSVFIKEADLADLVATKRIRYLDRLGREENSSRRATDLAYQEAHSFCAFLVRRQGREVLARVIAETARRPDFNLAFLAATGVSYVTLEEQWHQFLLTMPRATMLKLAQDTFWIFLVLALPLLVLAVARRRNRDMELQRYWEEQERAHTVFGRGRNGETKW